MDIWLNGEIRQVAPPETVHGLMESLEIPLPTLLVEHNGIALRREEWKDSALAPGDRLEVIRIVAGG